MPARGPLPRDAYTAARRGACAEVPVQSCLRGSACVQSTVRTCFRESAREGLRKGACIEVPARKRLQAGHCPEMPARSRVHAGPCKEASARKSLDKRWLTHLFDVGSVCTCTRARKCEHPRNRFSRCFALPAPSSSLPSKETAGDGRRRLENIPQNPTAACWHRNQEAGERRMQLGLIFA